MDATSSLLSAVHLATRKLVGSERIDETLREVLSICMQATGALSGTIYLHNKATHELEFKHVLPEDTKINLKSIPDNFGKAGQAFTHRQTVLSEFSAQDEERKKIDAQAGTIARNMISVPIMIEGDTPIGVVQLINKAEGIFDASDASVLETVGSVSTMAFINARLMEESTRANQLLGMGRVGHDIKNMAFTLDAVFSFADETMDDLKASIKAGEMEKAASSAEEVDSLLGDLSQSIDRIKRYSTLMSDLSAGADLKPQIEKKPMAETIETAASYFGTMARASRVQLLTEIKQLPAYPHDDMFVFRMVQNLVSNAIKAIGEQGRDDQDPVESVTLRFFAQGKKQVLEVADTGPGMPDHVKERILQGNAVSKWTNNSGSGWGTKIVLELAKAHKAVVEIDSVVGQGTTFRVVFP